MKRIWIGCICWWMLLMVNTSGAIQKMDYIIYFDSDCHEEYEVKEEVIQTYKQLTENVDMDSKAVIIRNNLDKFLADWDREIQLDSATLIIEMGDSKGSRISGYFESPRCMPEVKPKSMIMEWIEEVMK